MAGTAEFQEYGGGRLYGLNRRVNRGPACFSLFVPENRKICPKSMKITKIPRVRACS